MGSTSVSSNRVFGQQVSISFQTGDGTDNYLGLVDNFQFQFDDMVKANAALGQAGKGKIEVINDGGSGSFDDKQADAILVTFFINQAVQQRATSVDSQPNVGLRGATPLYTVKQETTFVDGTVLTLKFHQAALHNYNGGVSGNKEEFGEKWSMTFGYATFIVENSGASLNSESFNLLSVALGNMNAQDGGTATPTSFFVAQPE